MPDPGQMHPLAVTPEDEIGERPSGRVRRGHTVPDVPAGPGQALIAIEPHRREPVTRNPDGTTPAVGDPRFACLRKQLAQRALEAGEHRRLDVESVSDPRAEVIRSTAAAEGDAVVAGALGVDDEVPSIVQRLSAVPSDGGPECRGQWLGSDHQRVEGYQPPA